MNQNRTMPSKKQRAKRKEKQRQWQQQRPKAAIPDPEPAPIECDTCCEWFGPDMLIPCETRGCHYKQCATCVVKCGAQECMKATCTDLHWQCPACRKQTAGVTLLDNRFDKVHVIQCLRNTQKTAKEVVGLIEEEAFEIYSAALRIRRLNVYE